MFLPKVHPAILLFPSYSYRYDMILKERVANFEVNLKMSTNNLPKKKKIGHGYHCPENALILLIMQNGLQKRSVI